MCDNINVIFKYLCRDSTQWVNYCIAPYEYFDMKQLDYGESLEIDSIPLYNDLIDYLPETIRKQIFKINIELSSNCVKKTIAFFQVFWNNQNNFSLDRKDFEKNKLVYHEKIISTIIPPEITISKNNVYEILRFVYAKDNVDLVYHGIINDNSDGSQSEILISPSPKTYL